MHRAALKNLVQTLWDYLCKYPMRDDMYGDVVKVLSCCADTASTSARLPNTHPLVLRFCCAKSSRCAGIIFTAHPC